MCDACPSRFPSFQKSLYSRGLGVGERTSCAHSRAMRAHNRVDAHDPCALLASPHAMRGAAGKCQGVMQLSLSRRRVCRVLCVVLVHFLTRHVSRMPARHPLTTQLHTRRVSRLRRGVRSTRSERGLWSCRNTQTQGTCARTATNIRGPPTHKIKFSAFTLRRMGARHLPAHVHHFELKERSVLAMAYKA